MSKQVISVDGQDTVVREDTAKAFRGTHWALLSIGAFILIVALLFFFVFSRLASDGQINNEPPATGRDEGR